MTRAARFCAVGWCCAFLTFVIAVSAPKGAVAAPFAYVANSGSNDANGGSNNVSVIDLANDSVIDTIPLGTPAGTTQIYYWGLYGQTIVASASLPRVYVAHRDANNYGFVSVIDTSDDTVLSSDRICQTALSIDAVGQQLCLSCFSRSFQGGSVVADLRSDAAFLDLIDEAPVFLAPPGPWSNPIGSTFSRDGGTAYVAHPIEFFGGSIDAFDSATGTSLFSLSMPNLGFAFDFGRLPWTLLTDPTDTRLFFAHQFADALATIDLTTETVLPFLPLGARPFALAVSAAGDRVYVSLANGSIAVVDPTAQSVVDTIVVGGLPVGLLLTADDTLLYVVDQANDRVRVVELVSGTVAVDIVVGSTPVALAAMPCRGGDADSDQACDLDDNCPDTANPDQNDEDGDGAGDVCDLCTNVGGSRTFLERPRARLTLSGRIEDSPLRFARLRLRARAAFPPTAALDPSADGARVVVLAPDGSPILDQVLAPGLLGPGGTAGWRPRGSDRWTYIDRDVNNGVRRLTLSWRGRERSMRVRLKAKGSFAGDETGGAYQAYVIFGDQDAAAAGLCGESDFASLQDCQLAATRRRLVCSQ